MGQMSAMGLPTGEMEIQLAQKRNDLQQLHKDMLAEELNLWSQSYTKQQDILGIRVQLTDDLKEQRALLQESYELYVKQAHEARITIVRPEQQGDLLKTALELDLKAKETKSSINGINAELQDQVPLMATLAGLWESIKRSAAKTREEIAALNLITGYETANSVYNLSVAGRNQAEGLRDARIQFGAQSIGGSWEGQAGAALALQAGLLPGQQLPGWAQDMLGTTKSDETKKAKISTMQYLQALGMLTQMTGMGGKTGGIGQVLSSYSAGVSMWSTLGGTTGASMLGLGAGSIWGVAGVLLSGLGGLFKKDKVDYEKWLSKIAHNTAKMAEAYDTHYAAPPSALMPAPFAFAGIRGGF